MRRRLRLELPGGMSNPTPETSPRLVSALPSYHCSHGTFTERPVEFTILIVTMPSRGWQRFSGYLRVPQSRSPPPVFLGRRSKKSREISSSGHYIVWANPDRGMSHCPGPWTTPPGLAARRVQNQTETPMELGTWD